MSETIENLPIHIAVIPDGNRRWAKKKGFKPWFGHLQGAKTLEKILAESLKLKIKTFTFWAGSFDNLTKRTKKETDYLFRLYERYLTKLAKRKEIQRDKIKIQVFGRWSEIFPLKTKEAIKKIEEATKNNGGYFLNILIAYNGTDEMLEAVRKISDLKIPPEKITAETIKANLWTKNLAPVDLIIRTGEEGDPHNSAGFMMWDTAYSQYYFTKTLWPDFTPEEFKKSVANFLKTERRKGE